VASCGGTAENHCTHPTVNQQRKVPFLSEEEFVNSLKKRIPANKWDVGPSRYIASIAYRHFILILKTETVV
jgi:hypothetical protein